MTQYSTLCILLMTVISLHHSEATFKRNITAEWNSLMDTSFKLSGRSIEFPCNSTKTIYKESSRYIPKNVIVTRMQFHKYDAIVALPRYNPGVPITLGKVELKYKSYQPTIQPYPNWSVQQEGNCDAIQSAVDIFVDREDTLWVLDDGVIDSLGASYRRCPPKVVAVSLLTNEVVKTIDLSSFVTPKSNLQYIVTENVAGEDYVYISDAQESAIIMFNAEFGKGRRLILPPAITKGCLKNRALYLSILMKADHNNYLYFTYIDSEKMYAVETSTLHENDGNGAILEVGSVGSGIVFCGTDSLSNLFFRQKDSSDILIWDSNTSWKRDNWVVVQRGSMDRQVTHVTPGPWKLLWAMESNVRDFVSKKAGSFGASTLLHPIGRDVDDKPFRLHKGILKH